MKDQMLACFNCEKISNLSQCFVCEEDYCSDCSTNHCCTWCKDNTSEILGASVFKIGDSSYELVAAKSMDEAIAFHRQELMLDPYEQGPASIFKELGDMVSIDNGKTTVGELLKESVEAGKIPSILAGTEV